MAGLSEHAPHDVLAPLVQHHLDQGLAGCGVDDAERVDLDRAVLEHDALAQSPPEVARHLALDLREVGLQHAVARVLEPVRQFAVVGEDEQALGVGVQPADVEEPLLAVGDEVTDVDSGRRSWR